MSHSSADSPQSKCRLTKHEGLGNDFLVAVFPEHSLGGAEAKLWCDRRRGIGADGLIQITRSEAGPAAGAAPAELEMTLWNADGSRAEISGNGIRCAAQALAMAATGSTVITEPASFALNTDAGIKQLELEPTQDAAEVVVRVDMGPPKPGPDEWTHWLDLGVAATQQLGVDMGNPHLVALVDDPDRYDIAAVGAAVERDYPEGLNVHLVAVPDRASVSLVVWERGVGVTEACGSGACAAGYAAVSWGLADSPVEVTMPGGAAVVEVDEDTIYLRGPARFIGEVVMSRG